MKNLIYSLTIAVVVVLASACNKINDPGIANGQLIASKTLVKISEPDSLFLKGEKSTDSIKWSVVPAGFDSLITKGNAAVILFSKAGSYKVTASDNGKASSTTITVSDSLYAISFKGDRIALTPHYYKSVKGDTSYIYFAAQTTKLYNVYDKIIFTENLTANNQFSINFAGVQSSNYNGGPQGSLSAGIYFRQNQLTTIANGTYPLTVKFNNTDYTGSIVVSSTSINFVWNYSSGILIDPKQISK